MAEDAEVEMVGMNQLITTMTRYGQRTPQLLASALLDEAHVIFRISQVQVPFKFGGLKGSGRVSPPAISGKSIMIDISYGGPALAYAAVMHRGTMNGKEINYRNGKKAHYLSDPFAERAPQIAANVEERIQRMISGS